MKGEQNRKANCGLCGFKPQGFILATKVNTIEIMSKNNYNYKIVNLVVKQKLLDNQMADAQRKWEKSCDMSRADTIELRRSKEVLFLAKL